MFSHPLPPLTTAFFLCYDVLGELGGDTDDDFLPNDGDQMAAAVVEDPGTEKAKRRNQGFFETGKRDYLF